MIYWKDLFARIKPRLSYEDVRRICVRHAGFTIEMEPMSAAFKELSETGSPKELFWQWQLKLAPSLKEISEPKSRTEQARRCRMAILQSEEMAALNGFLMKLKDPELRDALCSITFSEELSEAELFPTLILQYAYSLLDNVGLSGLYEQQFNHYLSEDEFSNPYRAICRMYTHVLCFTYVINELRTVNENPEIQSLAQTWLDKIPLEVLGKLREAKNDFEAWIEAGHVHGIDELRNCGLALLDEYSEGLESVKKDWELLSKDDI